MRSTPLRASSRTEMKGMPRDLLQPHPAGVQGQQVGHELQVDVEVGQVARPPSAPAATGRRAPSASPGRRSCVQRPRRGCAPHPPGRAARGMGSPPAAGRPRRGPGRDRRSPHRRRGRSGLRITRRPATSPPARRARCPATRAPVRSSRAAHGADPHQQRAGRAHAPPAGRCAGAPAPAPGPG